MDATRINSNLQKVMDVLQMNSMTRRKLIYGLGAFAGSSLLTGCGGRSTNTASSSQIQPMPSGSLIQASVTVGASSGTSIGANFTGLSYEKNSFAVPRFTSSNTDMINLFKLLGTSILRVGGNSVDVTTWTANGAGQTAGQAAPADVDALAAFLKATGWQVLYGVNLASNTPALAAEEVAYAVKSLGSSLYAIEIGNEPDLFPGTYFPSNWTLQDFEALWELYRSAILATSPSVVITGPASGGNISSWTVPFGIYATKQQISLLTQHYYRGDGQSPSSTAELLISPDTNLAPACRTLLNAANQIGIPFRFTETNSFYRGGASGVSDSYASSLWVIDHLANLALDGGIGANVHGGGDGNGYTPIADDNGAVVEVRPEFYGLLLFTMLGQGSLLTTTVSAGSLNVTAYTVKTASGALNIVLNNKDLTNNLQVAVDCRQTVSSALLLEMTGPDLTATSGVTIQGASINLDGSFSPAAAYIAPQISGKQVTCYVPALSAVLLQVK
jgi:hypothetical protein